MCPNYFSAPGKPGYAAISQSPKTPLIMATCAEKTPSAIQTVSSGTAKINPSGPPRDLNISPDANQEKQEKQDL
jgi:hypothetical protein